MQSMTDIMKEALISHAIKCNYDENLETILNKLKKPELKAIVDAHGLKGCSSLAKGGLIERIKESIADATRLEYILLGLSETMMSDFVMLANEPYVTVDQVMTNAVQTLCTLGYVLPVMKDKEVVLVMPEIVKEAFQSIDMGQFEADKVQVDRVYLYMKALVNMYGVCEFTQLVSLFNEYENEELSHQDALNILLCKLSFMGDVQAFGPLFVNDVLVCEADSEMEVVELYESHKDMPYYKPTQEEIMQYGTDQGEWTPQLEKLADFLAENVCQDEKQAREIAHEMALAFVYRYVPKYSFMTLEQHGIELDSYETVQTVTALLMDAYRHARRFELKGFRQVDNEEGTEQQVVIPTLTPLKSTKVGRNEPCPCGSSKKYKKCCGR